MKVEVKNVEKEERESKSKEVKSKCKKISHFFPNVNKQLADPTSIQSLSNDNQAVEAINLEYSRAIYLRFFFCRTLHVVYYVFCVQRRSDKFQKGGGPKFPKFF